MTNPTGNPMPEPTAPLTIEEQCAREGGQPPTEGECKLMVEKLRNGRVVHPSYLALLVQWLLEQMWKYRNTEPGVGKTLYSTSRQSSCHYNREWELANLWRDKADELERARSQLDAAYAELEALRKQVRV